MFFFSTKHEKDKHNSALNLKKSGCSPVGICACEIEDFKGKCGLCVFWQARKQNKKVKQTLLQTLSLCTSDNS